MARVELAPEVADDFDRILEHLRKYQVEDASSRVHDIIAAISVLERNPFIGRPVEAQKRELVIGRGSRGYLALYRYVPEVDTVFVLSGKPATLDDGRDLGGPVGELTAPLGNGSSSRSTAARDERRETLAGYQPRRWSKTNSGSGAGESAQWGTGSAV